MASTADAPTSRPHKSALLAVLLQCIPLLGAVSCFANSATDQEGGLAMLLWFSVLLWGLGYLYLRNSKRFVLTWVLGPIFAVGSCFTSFNGVTYDYEHPYDNNDASELEGANRASFQEGLIISGAVLLLAVDAWRLAVANNAERDHKSRQDLPGET